MTEVSITHSEWQYHIKISDDNTKGEKRVTVTGHTDGDPQELLDKVDKLFKEKRG